MGSVLRDLRTVTVHLLEHQGKRILAEHDVPIPRGVVVRDGGAAREATRPGAAVVIKSQIPTGKRGKAGAIRFAESPEEAQAAAEDLLGSTVAGHPVTELLVEERVDIAAELYAAVLNDPATKGPLVLFSSAGGMDIEEISAAHPDQVLRLPVDIRRGLDHDAARSLLDGTSVPAPARPGIADVLTRLYQAYRSVDAELVEVNPLAITGSGDVVALDCKLSLDPGALTRRPELVAGLGGGQPEEGTELERRARAEGFLFVELDGSVGVLANGAGLTMATLDAVHHWGGRPANFLEIGGDAYTRAVPALQLVLDNPRVRSLLVNFCGAFARTDVMTAGVVAALEELRPELPVHFSIHGTGEEEATQLVRDRLGVEPHDLMDDAVRAAVRAAAAEEVHP